MTLDIDMIAIGNLSGYGTRTDVLLTMLQQHPYAWPVRDLSHHLQWPSGNLSANLRYLAHRGVIVRRALDKCHYVYAINSAALARLLPDEFSAIPPKPVRKTPEEDPLEYEWKRPRSSGPAPIIPSLCDLLLAI